MMVDKRAARKSRSGALEKAFATLLAATGTPACGPTRQTPRRAAALWCDHLLVGEGIEPRSVLGRGVVIVGQGQAGYAQAPVCVTHMGVHLVCPHHLTVAFGEAHLAYMPQDRVVGFGTLSRLAKVCTARLILQEDAGQLMAEALVEGLNAQAALVTLEATHPCHNVLHPRSHHAKAVTEAVFGQKKHHAALRAVLHSALREHPLG